jgi:hypothetical protein
MTPKGHEKRLAAAAAVVVGEERSHKERESIASNPDATGLRLQGYL